MIKKLISVCGLFCVTFNLWAAEKIAAAVPLPLDSYQDQGLSSVGSILFNRIEVEPFNLAASIVFACAIVHAFMTGRIRRRAHQLHEKQLKIFLKKHPNQDPKKDFACFRAEILDLLGEVEAVFGVWLFALLGMFLYYKDWHTFVAYIENRSYTEAMFVVVIMALASAKPLVRLAEHNLHSAAGLLGGKTAAYWFLLLSIPPLLGSFITEPGAMTIGATLLGQQFYQKKPPKTLAYATLGLLFVNISVGGTLTHFAAPPVLIVSNAWGWGIEYMLTNFGWKAIIGILLSNTLYFLIFKKQLQQLDGVKTKIKAPESKIPVWIVLCHVAFVVWTVFTAHHPTLFIAGFLFYMAFAQATRPHQADFQLKSPLLVGFFLAGLVTHGGLQGWWIAPLLGSFDEVTLMIGATVLTAFNDNAAITYLASLVPDFGESMRYAVVAGALTGGGLTVIANAPNPAGQAILHKHFENGISPAYLALGAIVPTVIVGLCFMLL